jgi:long-chain acyl-CoA synthetase
LHQMSPEMSPAQDRYKRPRDRVNPHDKQGHCVHIDRLFSQRPAIPLPCQTPQLILDYVYDHETTFADRAYLSQPVGAGKVDRLHLVACVGASPGAWPRICKAGVLAPGARIAILSKNCAHFFMAELAVWLGGYSTVAIFPTENADTVRYVLEHSEASLLFVGKLDTWPLQRLGVPQRSCPASPCRWHPAPAWRAGTPLVARTPALLGRPQRAPDDWPC